MALNRNKPLVAHVVGTGANAVIIELPDNYSSIKSVVGVDKLTGDPPDGAVGSTVAQALRAGLIAKIRISYMDDGKIKSANIVCEIGKLKTALSSLRGKSYASQTIKTAYLPSRRRFV